MLAAAHREIGRRSVLAVSSYRILNRVGEVLVVGVSVRRVDKDIGVTSLRPYGRASPRAVISRYVAGAVPAHAEMVNQPSTHVNISHGEIIRKKIEDMIDFP